jgi:hypothetical protein
MITTERKSNNLEEAYFNTKHIGSFVRDVDGFFYYSPNSEGGIWAEYELREIADKLKEMNKAWNEEIERVFSDPCTCASTPGKCDYCHDRVAELMG